LRKENQDESVLSVDIFGLVEVEEEMEEGLKIYLEDSHGELIGISTTNDEGAFEFEGMKPEAQYTIRSEVNDPNSVIRILADDGTVLQTIRPGDENNFVYIRLGENDRVITITNELNEQVTVSENEQFNLPVIHFELDQAQLSKEGEQALDKVVLLLKKNPEISVDISGHTDSRGPANYNLKLSQERMDAVIVYLNNAGIAKSRLIGKGFGESQLKNGCKDGVDCSEEEHALNRRTEIRVYKK
jgi:outer membrane protein OmpA-like peptidoglycan-associated protein